MTAYPPPVGEASRPPADEQYPPRPPGVVPATKAPQVAWLLPVAALLSVIGAVTSWFHPYVSIRGKTIRASGALYSFRDGKIGLVAPIVLVVIGVTTIGLLQGRVRGRLAAADEPARSLGKYAIVGGAVSGVCLVIAWLLVPTQYQFGSQSWDDFEKDVNAAGGSLNQGPQFGYWLSAAAAVVAIVAGVLMTLQKPPPPPT
jgi:hypothetical protein